MFAHVSPNYTSENVNVAHSVRGYLAYCQDQTLMEELREEGLTDACVFKNVASLWKQIPQECRRLYEEDAAKGKPHSGERDGSHPSLTPYEVQGLIEALTIDDTPWSLVESDEVSAAFNPAVYAAAHAMLEMAALNA